MYSERTPERRYYKPMLDMRVDAVALNVSSQLPQGPHVSEVEVAGADTSMRIHYMHDEATKIRLYFPQRRSLQDGPILLGYTFVNSGEGWDVFEELSKTQPQIEVTTTPYKVQMGESHVMQLEAALAEQQFMCILTQDRMKTKQSVLKRLLEKLRYVPLNISVATLGLSSTLELIVEENTESINIVLDQPSADLNNYLNSVLADLELAHSVKVDLVTPSGAVIAIARDADGILHGMHCKLPVEEGVSGDVTRGYDLRYSDGSLHVREWIRSGTRGSTGYGEHIFDSCQLDFTLACDLMLLLEEAEVAE